MNLYTFSCWADVCTFFGVRKDTRDPETQRKHAYTGIKKVLARSEVCLALRFLQSTIYKIGYPSLSALLPFSSPSLAIFSHLLWCCGFGLLSHDPLALSVFFDTRLFSDTALISLMSSLHSALFISLRARRVSQREEISFYLSWFISSLYLCLMSN